MDDLTPITREETFLAAAGGQGVTLPEPLTREELFLAKAAGESVEPPEPITREEMFLNAIQGGGGGGGVTVEALSVTENGTYAEEGKAYNPVVVEVGEPEQWVTEIKGTFVVAQTMYLGVQQEHEYDITVDWGDGSAPEPIAGSGRTTNAEHAFAAGDFHVRIITDPGVTMTAFGFLPDDDTANIRITIGPNAPTLSARAFLSDDIRRIIIPEHVATIETRAFASNPLVHAEIAATYVETGAFYDCTQLSSVWIRDTVETIEATPGRWGAFCDCPNVTIYCEADSKPAGWETDWDRISASQVATVVWGQKVPPPGTLSDPWWVNDPGDLLADMIAGKAYAVLTMDGTAIGMGTDKFQMYPSNDGDHLLARGAIIRGDGSFQAGDGEWTSAGVLQAADLAAGQSGQYQTTNIMPYAGVITTQLDVHRLDGQGA